MEQGVGALIMCVAKAEPRRVVKKGHSTAACFYSANRSGSATEKKKGREGGREGGRSGGPKNEGPR